MECLHFLSIKSIKNENFSYSCSKELKLCREKDFFPTQNSECCVTDLYNNYEQFASSLTMNRSFEKVNRFNLNSNINPQQKTYNHMHFVPFRLAHI